MTPDELRLRLLPQVETPRGEPLATGRSLFPGRVWGPLSRSPEWGAILVTEELPWGDLQALLGCAGWVVKASGADVASEGWEIPALHADALPDFHEGEFGFLDTVSGGLYRGAPHPGEPSPLEFELPQGRLQVLANADSTADWQLARRYGAQGIGLCRLERLEGEISGRLRGLYRAAARKPVTVRLLDPAPTGGMGGWRWCRAGLRHPANYRKQLKAIFGATQDEPRILVPGPVVVEEVAAVRKLAEEFQRPFALGAMLELPRACLAADELAQVADFLTFGTNDLTQAVLGMARDEARFELIPYYLKQGFLKSDPFRFLDERVVELMALGLERAGQIPVGVCGDHAGVPANIPTLDRLGVNWVSCYPRQVPLVRLAAGGEGSP